MNRFFSNTFLKASILLLSLVFTLGCSNDIDNIIQSGKDGKTIDNQSNKNLQQFVSLVVPNQIKASGSIVSKFLSKEITLEDFNDSRISVVRNVKFQLDSQNKIITMEVSKNIMDHFSLPNDFLLNPNIDYGNFGNQMNSPCSCSVRATYWKNRRI